MSKRIALRGCAVMLVVAAIVWLRVNGPFEGPVLLRLTYSHGVTLADLASVAACLLAARLWWAARRTD